MRVFKAILICLFMLAGTGFMCKAQVTVGLDNWFNNEFHPRTGLPFHYLWNDSADSGYSRWGDIFRQQDAKTVTIYKPDPESLDKIDVYIIVDPDSIIETPSPNFIQPEEIELITNWVKQGGVLVLMANDGQHCGLTSLNMLSANFGILFNNVVLHPVIGNQWEMGAYTDLPDHPVFEGVKRIYMKEVASMTLSGKAKAVLTDNGQVVIAEAPYGKGFVFAVGDPWIYNEYIDHDRLPESFENRKAAENLTRYLISKAGR